MNHEINKTEEFLEALMDCFSVVKYTRPGVPPVKMSLRDHLSGMFSLGGHVSNAPLPQAYVKC